MTNKKSNKIKAGVLITILILITTTILVVADRVTIYEKEYYLTPLGAEPYGQHTNIYICDDVDAQAYEGGADNGAFDDDDGEFTSGDYTAIEIDDTIGVWDEEGTVNKYQYHRFNFTLDEDISCITNITVSWNGRAGLDWFPDYVGISLWIKENDEWVQRIYFEGESDTGNQTYTHFIESNFNEVIQEGYFEVAIQSLSYTVSSPFWVYSFVQSQYIQVSVTTDKFHTHLGGNVVSDGTVTHILGDVHIGGNEG